jgi:hypothetical protein
MFNLFETIGSFFSHLVPGASIPPKTPDATENAILEVGGIIDRAEVLVTQLQALAPLLPPQFAGPASIFVNAVHTLDAYADTLETPAAAPSTPSAATPPPPATPA